jgi:YD repeat-containing protein
MSLAAFSGAQAGNTKTIQALQARDWQNPTAASLGLRGPVKTLLVEVAEPNMQRRPLRQCKFDRQGSAVECINYAFQKAGQIETRKVFDYDAKGNSVGYDEYSWFDGSEHKQTVRFTLDSQGHRTEQQVLDASGVPSTRFTYKYDRRGNLVEEAWYSRIDLNKAVGTTIYTYNNQGQLVVEEYKDSRRPELSWSMHYEYNSVGQITRTRQFKGDVLDNTTEFGYDKQGRRTTANTTTSNRPPNVGCVDCPQDGRVSYAYDSSGHVIDEITYNKSGEVNKVLRYGFDQFGNPTEQDAFLTDGSEKTIGVVIVNGKPIPMKWSNGLRHTAYTYDSYGNWTRADETTAPQFDINGPRSLRLSTFRTIEYY